MEIWKKLHETLPEWKFWVVGHGDQKGVMERFCLQHKLDRVTFFGKDNPNEYYKKAKLFHMTSAFEGFGNVLIESQSYGCVNILPALPDVWKAEGKVQGLRTRGGFLIEELAWKNGRITSLKIRSTLGGNLRLRLPAGNRLKGIKGMKSAKGKNPNPLFSAFEQPQMQNHSEVKLNKVVLPKANTYDITTRKGETIRLI
jgi:hypothetical protein